MIVLSLIIVTILINVKQSRDSFLLSKQENQWELIQDQTATNWIALWPTSVSSDRKPTLDEVWERETSRFKDHYHNTEQSDLVIEWLKETFPEAPYMIYVANCESRGLIHRKGDKLLPNASGGSDRGVLQIHMNTHGAEIQKMGLNIDNNGDYFYFTRILFDRNGVSPWNSSKHCWERDYERILSYV